jgi:hypothetical protein
MVALLSILPFRRFGKKFQFAGHNEPMLANEQAYANSIINSKDYPTIEKYNFLSKKTENIVLY